MGPIDVILTSYARWDLLERTLDSFFKINTHPINKFVIHEDKGLNNFSDHDWAMLLNLQSKFPSVIWITPNDRQGQVKAIDKLHECVTTEYYLTLEEDWECENDGFIKSGIQLASEKEDCICVWLRGIDPIATNNHPIIFSSEQECFYLSTEYHWKGFSFAPTIKKLADYKKIGKYGDHVTFNPTQPWDAEFKLGQLYCMMRYKAYTLVTTYFTHIGNNRGIRN